jgi:hypothetical protein
VVHDVLASSVSFVMALVVFRLGSYMPGQKVMKYSVSEGVSLIDSACAILMLSRIAGSYRFSQLRWKLSVVVLRVVVRLSKK